MKPRVPVPLAIAAGVAGVFVVGALLSWRASAKVNDVALASSPKPVSVVDAKQTSYRASRTYVGTLEPWQEAKIGPQLVSAYLASVVVRPGDAVKKGDVLATLDCRNADATSRAVAMQERAVEARQVALAHESTRVQGLLDGGFVSQNEAERKAADSKVEQAQLLATRAKVLGSALERNDCVLRAPFDGEITVRAMDPGAFVRPGTPIVSIVDRSTVRVVADAPEIDFDVVAPGTVVQLHLLATNRSVQAKVSRRAPAADHGTRTLRFELDIVDATRSLPVGTTAELRIDVGDAVDAREVPLSSASVRGQRASLFVVTNGVARLRVVDVRGERSGKLFLAPEIDAGAQVVSEGRALLSDGDRVTATPEAPRPATSTAKEAP